MKILRKIYNGLDLMRGVRGHLSDIQARRDYRSCSDQNERRACEWYDDIIANVFFNIVREDGKISLIPQFLLGLPVGVVCLVLWLIQLIAGASWLVKFITFAGGIALLIMAFSALMRLYQYLLEADKKATETIRDGFLEEQYGHERVQAEREARKREEFIKAMQQRQSNRYRRNRYL